MGTRLDAMRREVWNLPNMITIGRLFLIPPVLLLIDSTDPFRCFLAMALFLIASLLDVVDGWLARRSGLVTFFGKFMDPLADKIMAASLLVYLVADGRLAPWIVAVLLGREFYMSGLRTLALNEGIEIVADAGGKAKTSSQLVGISLILLHYSYRDPLWGSAIHFSEIGLMLVYLSVVLSIYSGFSYTRSFIQEIGRRKDTSGHAESGHPSVSSDHS